MIRRLAYVLVAFALLFSCTKDEYWDGPVIQLTLNTGDAVETRAGNDGVEDGIDKYNENLINWVDFFFYPDDRTSENATFHARKESGKRRSDVLRIELGSDDINNLIFPSQEDIRNCTVFAVVNYPGTMVNHTTVNGKDVADLSGTSLPELEELVVTSDFVSPANHRQTSFLMSGSTDLTLRGRSVAVTAAGTIDLQRYACKLTVGVDVADEVEIGTEKWQPMIHNMEIYLVNGVCDVNLGGEKTTDPTYFSYKNNPLPFAYMDLQDQVHSYFEKDGNYYNTYPTYMYPQHWTYGSTDSPDKEPFLKLVVPWVRVSGSEGTGTQKQYYYKIIIPDDRRSEFKCRFVRNNWYHINIKVSILGSETDEAMVPIENAWCYIVDWQDKDVVIKNAEIGNARYLSVDKDTVYVRNISTDVRLNYTSSHPVTIQNIQATRPYYGEKTTVGDPALGGTICKAGDNDIYPKDSYYLSYDYDQRLARNEGKEWVTDSATEEGTAIIFQHKLENNYENPLFDYSPYTVTFTLRHADRPNDSSFEKKVTVIQSPAIYIEYQENSDPTVRATGKPKPNNYTSTYWGYVYVDGAQRTRAEYDAKKDVYVANGETWDSTSGGTVRTKPDMMDLQWRIVHYTGGSRSIYKMNITVLPEGSDFLIGDPRTDEIDNLNPVMLDGTPVPFCTAPTTVPKTNTNGELVKDGDGNVVLVSTGEQRSLTYYYPADPSDRTRDLMAPAYRIASKHGGIEYYNGTPMAEARYRCATYQEDGYPAGRWRLPTRGEIRFIAMLSANEAFTFLFSNGSYYWSANGAIQVKDKTVLDAPKQTYALTRCVYDTWYWGDSRLEDKTIFTWGDQPR